MVTFARFHPLFSASSPKKNLNQRFREKFLTIFNRYNFFHLAWVKMMVNSFEIGQGMAVLGGITPVGVLLVQIFGVKIHVIQA